VVFSREIEGILKRQLSTPYLHLEIPRISLSKALAYLFTRPVFLGHFTGYPEASQFPCHAPPFPPKIPFLDALFPRTTEGNTGQKRGF